MEILRQREVKELIEKLTFFYEDNLEFLEKYFFYINRNSGKIYISKINVNLLNLDRVNLVGIYFGTFHDQRFRLSIEGSKFIQANNNYVILKETTLSSYLSAENLFKDEVEKIKWENNAPFLIVKHKDENIGCVSVKGKELLTYMPKSRKLDFDKVY